MNGVKFNKMLSQYARLVREGCVMSSVETAYQLNHINYVQAAGKNLCRSTTFELSYGSLRLSSPLSKPPDACKAIVFLQRCAKLCYEQSICRRGHLQNSAAMYFWDEYDQIVSRREYFDDITRMSCLLVSNSSEALIYKRIVSTLMKGAYAPSVMPAFTSIYFKLLKNLVEDELFPLPARFKYKTLLRSFNEADFETTPVCKCCYRRVCTIEILEALPGYIWDNDDPLDGEDPDESDETSFRSAPSERDMPPTTAWFDGWARRETLQDGLNDVYAEFLQASNAPLSASVNQDIESFCAILNLKQRNFDSMRSFISFMHPLCSTLTPSELKYWYTIQDELLHLVLNFPKNARNRSKVACILGAEFLAAVWSACESESGKDDFVSKHTVTSAIIREIHRMSPLLAMWAGVVLAKSLLGQNMFEGLEVGIIYVIRCILPIAAANMQDASALRIGLVSVMEMYPERLDFRVFASTNESTPVN